MIGGVVKRAQKLLFGGRNIFKGHPRKKEMFSIHLVIAKRLSLSFFLS